MSLSDAEEIAMVIAMVGDEQNILLQNVPLLWDLYASKAQIYPDLRLLYVRRDAINLVLPTARKKANFAQAGGAQVSASVWFDHLLLMQKTAQAEIVRLEAKAARSRSAGAAGTISTVTGSVPPGSPNWVPPPPYVDANSSLYKGDPYLANTDELGAMSIVQASPGGGD